MIYVHDISAAGYENRHAEGNLFGIELSDPDLRRACSNSIFRFDARLKGLNSELRGLTDAGSIIYLF